MNNPNIKFIFIRHGKLDLPYKDHSEMPLSVIADLGTTKLDPGIDMNFLRNKAEILTNELPLEMIQRIVVSTSQRCIETGSLIAHIIKQKTNRDLPIFQEENLREVRFDIMKITEEFDTKPELPELNKLIFQAMVGIREDSELASSALDRAINIIEKYKKEDGITLFITHSFMLEALQMYISNKNTRNPNKQYEILLNVPRIKYACGFTMNSSTSKIISYINT